MYCYKWSWLTVVDLSIKKMTANLQAEKMYFQGKANTKAIAMGFTRLRCLLICVLINEINFYVICLRMTDNISKKKVCSQASKAIIRILNCVVIFKCSLSLLIPQNYFQYHHTMYVQGWYFSGINRNSGFYSPKIVFEIDANPMSFFRRGGGTSMSFSQFIMNHITKIHL